MRAAVQQLPAAAGLDLANWNWKVVHRLVWERCGLSLCRSSWLTYLRRLGFAFKRPKKRLLKADEEKREAFVAAYAALREEAVGSGAKIFFADEAHFRADAELRGRWVPAGRASPGELQQSAVWRESQLLFGGVFWRRERWHGWTGRETATAEPRQPFWTSCARGTLGRFG